jgi:hypothetical protein
MMGKDRIDGFCEEANIVMLAMYSKFSLLQSQACDHTGFTPGQNEVGWKKSTLRNIV